MKLSNLAVAAALTLVASGAEAQTVYNSRTDWLTNVSGVTTTTFNGVVPAGWFGAVGSIDGVNYTVDGAPTLIVFDGAFLNGVGSDGAAGMGLDGYISATFGAPVSAVGFDFGGLHNAQFSVVTSTGVRRSFTYSNNAGFDFWGITSDTPMAWIEISMLGSWALIDNFSFASGAASVAEQNENDAPNQGGPVDDENDGMPGQEMFVQTLAQDIPPGVTVTPEPGSFALLGAGLAGVLAARRRKRARNTE